MGAGALQLERRVEICLSAALRFLADE
eukprot:COSAG03_NODE_13194_length_512_cov_126.932203_1_plen_26_part_10